MPPDDLIRLKHMLDAAKAAIAAIQGRDYADLDKDYIWSLGLVKTVEIIGEAASRISDETRRQYPEIPWPQIVATRNRLIHAYFEIDLEQVWKTVTEDLPPMIAALEKYQ